MVKILSGRIHGILDYLTVSFLLISPGLFNMQDKGAEFTRSLAVVHLVLTLTTDFPPGIFRMISLRVHGVIELIVSIALVFVACWFRYSGDTVTFYFYLYFAATLAIVWLISDYSPELKKKENMWNDNRF